MSENKGEGISEIDSHINRKYEVRRRIGKGVSVKSLIIYIKKNRLQKSVPYQLTCEKKSNVYEKLYIKR